MLNQRIAIGLTMGPLALLLMYLGGLYFTIPVIGLFLFAAYEYTILMRKMELQVPVWFMLPAVCLSFVAAAVSAEFNLPYLPGAMLFVSLFVATLYACILYDRFDRDRAGLDWLAMSTGVVWLGLFGSHLLLLRGLAPATGSDGWAWTAIAATGAWISDTGAYLVGSFVAGRFIGKNRLTRRLSPKKTIEGFLGGILFGTGTAVLLAQFLFGLPLLPVALITMTLGFVGLIGDLGVSLLKRVADQSDSGKLFPGHGGALDRLDSLIWCVVFTYYALVMTGLLG